MKPARKKVLVIDDDDMVLSLLRETLESNDFECFTAHDAVEGFKKAADCKPGLIILDLMLPKMSGYGFLRGIKGNPGLAKIPVVILTSLTDSHVAMEALDLGAVSFLSKSCDSRELISTLQAYAA